MTTFLYFLEKDKNKIHNASWYINFKIRISEFFFLKMHYIKIEIVETLNNSLNIYNLYFKIIKSIIFYFFS